jgi:cobalt-zinc-cadmium efflux system membrane fusion protein
MQRKLLLQIGIWGTIAVLAGAAFLATSPSTRSTILGWFTGGGSEGKGKEEKVSHELVCDQAGRPVKPATMRLSSEAVKGLKVATKPVTKAGNLTLPSQIGTLGYDTDLLFPVRAPFQGVVTEIGKAKNHFAINGGSQQSGEPKLLGPGNRVKEGDLLAIIWSKELGDRKVALISALLDLYFDEDALRRVEGIYLKGSYPESSYRAQVSKVEKDLATVFAAESSLGISRLSPKEIEEIREEAKTIQKRLQASQGKPETFEQRQERIKNDVDRWAVVKVVAPRDGLIVEKNTNVRDMVDPSKDTPMFRIADLSSLLIVANFHEEYLPYLQPLLQIGKNAPLRWKITVEAEPDLPALDLPIARLAPSVDPNQHTVTVLGQLTNPVHDNNGQPKHLLVGQFVTATIDVPPPPGVVEIPTTALNEVNGESLVFVQPDPARAEYVLKRVVVVRRSKDTTLVRTLLTAEDRLFSAKEVLALRRPLETLEVGDLVVVHGVTEMTEALEGLLAKLRAETSK